MISDGIKIEKSQEPEEFDVFNQQETTSTQPEPNLTNKQEMPIPADSAHMSQSQVQSTNNAFQNTNLDCYNTNVQGTSQANMNPIFYNTLPNLPPPPIHSFPPPNFPPPFLPPTYSLPPQYPPHYPPPLPNNHQYHNMPQ